jgi:CelD/BcsL family acetyltransferase involved in cellulose biosynthesis
MIARARSDSPRPFDLELRPERDQYATIPRSALSVEHVKSLEELQSKLPLWQRLYAASASTNPFLDPLWLTAWAKHYTAANELDVMLVSGDGNLVGVAPFYYSRARALGLGPTRLHLLGAGRRDDLTELTEPLLMPQRKRAILKTIVGEVCSTADWDWLELELAADQGWLETQWLPMRGMHPRFVVLPKGTAASVVLALRGDGNAVSLKRNLRRNMRHRHNSLRRQGVTVDIKRLDEPAQMSTGLQTLHLLHNARAAMTGVPWHPDMMRSSRTRAFLADAVSTMAAVGHAAIFLLTIDSQPAAVQLVLIANGCYYLALSGLDPSWWHSSPLTLLTASIIDDAAANGASHINFSTGPNSAKLAWSEEVQYHQSLLVIRRSVLASARFAGYWQAHSFVQFCHEYRQQRRQAAT